MIWLLNKTAKVKEDWMGMGKVRGNERVRAVGSEIVWLNELQQSSVSVILILYIYMNAQRWTHCIKNGNNGEICCWLQTWEFRPALCLLHVSGPHFYTDFTLMPLLFVWNKLIKWNSLGCICKANAWSPLIKIEQKKKALLFGNDLLCKLVHLYMCVLL